MTTESGFANRDLASSYLTAILASRGVEVLRVHDIQAHRLALAVGSAISQKQEQADKHLEAYR